MLNDGVHEETPISCEERSIFAHHYVQQLPVVGVFAVGDIKSEEAKIAGKFSQMSIRYKFRNMSGLQSFLRVNRVAIPDRKHFCLCVFRQRVIKADCLLINQDQINLRMRNAARLDDVFYGGFFCEPQLDHWITDF